VVIRKSSVSGGSTTNDFTINVGSSGNTNVLLSTSFPSGSYICTSSLSDASLDIYFIASDGTSAGYANATTATTTITATKSFNKVVIYGATNNDTLTFEFKYVFAPSLETTNYAAAARLISVSTASLPNIDQTTTLTGENFATDVEVVFIGTDNVERSPKSTTRNSSTSITVTRPDDLPTAYSPYSVKVTNPGISLPTSSGRHLLSAAISSGVLPSWTTSTSLTAFTKSVSYSQQVLATDSDGGSSVTYSIVSGTLPNGITFNTANSTFSGTPTENSTTPYSYTIRATDSGGNYVDRTFTLSQAVPDAPTIGTATDVGTSRAYNNGAASVTFTAPSYTGTSSITSYTVTASTGQTASGASSPIVVTGIATGATPTFTVTATNASGTSLSSTSSSAATITTVPETPTVGTASVTNSTTVSLPFTAGSNGGKSITSYTISSSPSISITTSGSSTPLTATGSYAAGQSYTFTVTATNANGTSSASSASNSITPLQVPSVSGGTLTSDATYYYRTFNSNGTLSVTNSTLTADVLVVGGGGGGGNGAYSSPSFGQCYGNATITTVEYGAGGGGGGVRYNTSTSFPVNNYSVVVGAGGANYSGGAASSVNAISSGGGNGGGGGGNAGATSGTPQSNPGGSPRYLGSGSITCDEGEGPFNTTNYREYLSGGGGGAGGAGAQPSSANTGYGGSSVSHFGTSYAAGGNAHGSTSASANTGSGGAGGNPQGTTTGGSGGSGRVIIRYTRASVGG